MLRVGFEAGTAAMIPQSMNPRSRNGLPGLMPTARWQLWTACLAVVAIGVAAQFFYMPHHDMAWLLYSADRVMQGEQLYRSLIEVNPPLIVGMSAVGVSIASDIDVTRSHGWVVFVASQIAPVAVAHGTPPAHVAGRGRARSLRAAPCAARVDLRLPARSRVRAARAPHRAVVPAVHRGGGEPGARTDDRVADGVDDRRPRRAGRQPEAGTTRC